MAASLNGIIARPDYREDFLSRQNWDSFLESVRRAGSLVWGRKTHEKVRRYGSQYLDQMKEFAKVVVSRDSSLALEEGFERADSPRGALARLEQRGLAATVLAGGSLLNRSFAREQLIDAVVINIEAVAIGRGIPLFAPDDFDIRFELTGVRRIGDNIVQVTARRRPASRSGDQN